MNDAVRLNNNVIRSLVLHIDERLIDAMVAHAAGQKAEGADGEEAAPKEGATGEKTSEEKPQAVAQS